MAKYESSAARGMESSGALGRVELTQGARRIIQQAEQAGIPPERIESTVLAAAAQAGASGRSKVGPFAGSREAFRGLETAARVEPLTKGMRTLKG